VLLEAMPASSLVVGSVVCMLGFFAIFAVSVCHRRSEGVLTAVLTNPANYSTSTRVSCHLVMHGGTVICCLSPLYCC